MAGDLSEDHMAAGINKFEHMPLSLPAIQNLLPCQGDVAWLASPCEGQIYIHCTCQQRS